MKFSELNGNDKDNVKSDNITINGNKNNINASSIENLYNKYSSFSEDELMREFLRQSAKQSKNGNLSKDKISSMRDVLFPYLNDKQKNKFNNLMKMVSDDSKNWTWVIKKSYNWKW